MAKVPVMKEEKNLGVIVVKHPSGIRETNDGHKTNHGEVGDTLMMGTDRKTYIVTQAEMKERAKEASSKETAVQERARLKAEAKAKAEEEARLKAEAKAKAEEEARLKAEQSNDAPPADGTQVKDEKGDGAGGVSGDAGAAQ